MGTTILFLCYTLYLTGLR